MTVSLTNLAKKRPPAIPYSYIAEKVLGKEFDLSLVLCSSSLIRKLNRNHRKKDTPANVLSFSLSPHSGEIFINLNKKGGFSFTHLFIHALLHLKGLRHSSKMDNEENKLISFFNNDQKYRHRHRHRDAHRTSGGS